MRKHGALVLLPLLTALMPWSADAQPPVHTEGWCADAVDFAMRTVEYRDLGRTQSFSLHAIEHDANVFRQQYPDLSTPDMKWIANRVYTRHWKHFESAVEMSKSCPARGETTAQPAPLLAAGHSEEWCANAVDFGMSMAEERESQYPEAVMTRSFELTPSYYHIQFPELSRDDMLGVTRVVYEQHWTRFSAAAAVAASCRVSSAPRRPVVDSPAEPATQQE